MARAVGIDLGTTNSVVATLRGTQEALVPVSPVQIPRLNTVHIDRSVLIFTVLASLLTGALCGLLRGPLLRSR